MNDDFDINVQGIPQPNVPVEVIPTDTGETFNLGKMVIRILEDGSHTDNRLSTAILTLPPHTPGPPAHWHEMHDETFYILTGNIRFSIRADSPSMHSTPLPSPSSSATSSTCSADGSQAQRIIDAKAGDYIVVPIRAPHTFSNPFDEEASILFTATPSFYVNYFRILRELQGLGKGYGPEMNKRAMAHFATVPARLEGDV